MWLGDDEHAVEANADTAKFYYFSGLDILDGLLIASHDGFYYTHHDDEGYKENREQLQHEGVKGEIISGSFCPEHRPFSIIIALVGKMIIDEAERIIQDAAPE